MYGTLIIFNSNPHHRTSTQSIKTQMIELAIENGVPAEQVMGMNRMAHIWNTVRRYFEESNAPSKGDELMMRMNNLFLVVEHREHDVSALLPDTIFGLQSLHNEGYEMGIVTSASRGSYTDLSMRDTFERFGSYFSHSITRDDVQYIKPNPEPLKLMMKLMGRKDVVYIGDSDHDGLAAKAAGCNFVLINTRQYSEKTIDSFQPDAIIENLGQLPEYLRNHHS